MKDIGLALDRTQPLPLYYQTYEVLRSQLANGIWKAGDFLPPIPDLASRFSVSVVTIRQALDLLRQDGLSVPNVAAAPRYWRARWVSGHWISNLK